MEHYVSRNGRYYLAVGGIGGNTGTASMYSSDGRLVISAEMTAFTVGGSRAAVSDSGEMFATAAYSHNGIDLRDKDGRLIWNTKTVRKVQCLCFDKDETHLIVCNGDETPHAYYISISDPSDVRRIAAENVICDPYGEDIVFKSGSKGSHVMINGKKIESPTFGYLAAIGTPVGIAVSPVSDDPRMYNRSGELLWVSPIVSSGRSRHILRFAYLNGILFALTRDSEIYMIDEKTGSILGIAGQNAVCILENGSSYLTVSGDIVKISVGKG